MRKLWMTALATAAMALPAGAQDKPWDALSLEAAAAAGFEAGKATGLSPQTDSEDFTCALNWDVWFTTFVSGQMVANIEQNLPSELSRGGSTTARDEWTQIIAINQDTTDMLARISLLDRSDRRQNIEKFVAAGLSGDKGRLYSHAYNLGTCSNSNAILKQRAN
jgi:hypothetical protein